MKNLLERMKPEFKTTIIDDDSWMFTQAVKALESKSNIFDLTLHEIVCITHFTHPEVPANVCETINIFNDD